jgi:hypothetical protein
MESHPSASSPLSAPSGRRPACSTRKLSGLPTNRESCAWPGTTKTSGASCPAALGKPPWRTRRSSPAWRSTGKSSSATPGCTIPHTNPAPSGSCRPLTNYRIGRQTTIKCAGRWVNALKSVPPTLSPARRWHCPDRAQKGLGVRPFSPSRAVDATQSGAKAERL